ncbi:MAG: hypothetical protein AAFO69_02335 [Bacteroidota bacterium]
MIQRLVTGLAILLVVVGVITVISYSTDNDTEVAVADYETNEYTEKINGKIRDFQSMKWDRDRIRYKNLAQQIRLYQDGELITEKAASGLNQLLENAYSKHLKDTAYSYCILAADTKYWKQLNDELVRYDQSGLYDVEEAVDWMGTYKKAYTAIYGAIRYAKSSGYTESRHSQYTDLFDKYKKGPVSSNQWLFKGSEAKVLQAKSDLINQFRVADKYTGWEAQFMPLSDTTGYWHMNKQEAGGRKRQLGAWKSVCDCDELSKLINNQYYNSQCDSLHELASNQMNLYQLILDK